MIYLDNVHKYKYFCCFSATVGNLQAKVEALTTTNALMKEDLEIAKTNILALIDENTKLKSERFDYNSADKISEVIFKYIILSYYYCYKS